MEAINRTNTGKKISYNKSLILKKAWVIYKTNNKVVSFSECLKRSWNIAKNGSEENILNEVYKKHYQPILFFINGMVKNIEVAQELTNDTFLKASKHLENYDVMKAKLNTWLYNIAKNITIDYFRSADNQKALKNSQISEFVNDNGKEFFQIADSCNNDYTEIEKGNTIQIALNKLDERKKIIANMAFIQGCSYEEIAEVCNISLANVKTIIFQLRKKLQSELASLRYE